MHEISPNTHHIDYTSWPESKGPVFTSSALGIHVHTPRLLVSSTQVLGLKLGSSERAESVLKPLVLNCCKTEIGIARYIIGQKVFSHRETFS